MTLGLRLTSRDNPRYRALVQLTQSARERRRAGRAVLEGVHVCQSWLAQRGAPEALYVSDSGAAHPEVQALVAQCGGAPVLLSDALFAGISSLEQGVGVLAVVVVPHATWPAVMGGDVVYLDRLQDPGNVGTVLRTCAAAGVQTIVTAPGTACCWSPKVVRAAMGAHAVVQLFESVPWSVIQARWRGVMLGTAARAPCIVFDADLRAPALWVFGHEGQGMAPEIEAALTQCVAIPQTAGVESLNVACAAAICLFEQGRQRRGPAPVHQA
jgi:TrmH family RNA methyltransferase